MSDETKIGLDDYLCCHSVEELQKLPLTEIKEGEDVSVKKTKKRDEACTKRNNLQTAKKLIDKYKIIRGAEQLYKYTDGYYKEIDLYDTKKIILDEYGETQQGNINDIVDKIKIFSKVELGMFNSPKYLNLKNGLFDIEEYELVSHTPSIYSTIRLEIEYNKNTQCPKWIDAVNEIVDDPENINTLQEFFGLCLTTETYDKALILTGEGSNGKSTLLDVLGGILGDDNISHVPLVRLEDTNFVAQLHGKLLNIASEIGSKTTVCDETFKKIITHDKIMGAHKYAHPFSFRPVCKLIFATNDMPRTNDKTKALYRRLLVIHLINEFAGDTEKHKYHRELLEEKDGIFNWLVEGLVRLRERGNFAMGKKIISAVEEYKKDNNPIISFIDDRCKIGTDETVSKKDMFDEYKNYCNDSAFKPLSKIKFGKGLKRCLDSQVIDAQNKSGSEKIWRGISVSERREQSGMIRVY